MKMHEGLKWVISAAIAALTAWIVTELTLRWYRQALDRDMKDTRETLISDIREMKEVVSLYVNNTLTQL